MTQVVYDRRSTWAARAQQEDNEARVETFDEPASPELFDDPDSED